MKLRGISRGGLLAAAAFGALCLAEMAPAQDGRQRYDIGAVDLDEALKQVSRVSGVEVMFASETFAGKRAKPLHGAFTARQALERLLDGTGMIAEHQEGGFVIRGRSEAAVSRQPSTTDPEIVVTGSHIRGAEVTSPVIVATRTDIETRGVADLGSYVRQIPQNFSGGQNPGIFSGGGQGGSANLNSSSNLNLRGLGPDATLTLMNGHRLAYDGITQGVDISAIPLAAIDRLEIVADGASAFYGSDAVAGVANVILRKDFQGLTTSARVGTTTDGGGTEQRYNAVAGKAWATGHLIATADYKHSTAITVDQRSHVTGLNGTASLLPGESQFSSIISGSQHLSDTIRVDLDGQYSNRHSSRVIPYSISLPARTSGTVIDSSVETFGVTPSIAIDLSENWSLSATGSYGESKSRAPGLVYSGGNVTTRNQVRYKDTIAYFDAYVEGAVARLPGGDLRLVAGGGYRETGLTADSSQTTGAAFRQVFDFDRKHRVSYAFGELAIPLVGPGNSRPLIRKLRVSAAFRYENYRSVADFLAPKVGLIYSPSPDAIIKFNWGKSFKAPTLYSQYRGYQAILLPAGTFGPSGAPSGSTVVYTAGANANLQPEKAKNWTATLVLSPRALPGLRVETSYFDIRYKDRVGTPIPSLTGAIANPIYQHLVTLSPTVSQINALSSAALFGLENSTGGAYNPAAVYAIVQNVSQNTAQQWIRGIDVSASYRLSLSDHDTVDLQASATHLDSDRRLLAGLPSTDVAGTIFNPPHWRAQGGVSWQHDDLTFSGFTNYIGGTRDNRLSPTLRVNSFVSVDLTGQWKSRAKRGLLHGVDLLLSVGNLLNERPDTIRTAGANAPSYDTTNYPVIGRTLSLMIRKEW